MCVHVCVGVGVCVRERETIDVGKENKRPQILYEEADPRRREKPATLLCLLDDSSVEMKEIFFFICGFDCWQRGDVLWQHVYLLHSTRQLKITDKAQGILVKFLKRLQMKYKRGSS